MLGLMGRSYFGRMFCLISVYKLFTFTQKHLRDRDCNVVQLGVSTMDVHHNLPKQKEYLPLLALISASALSILPLFVSVSMFVFIVSILQ